MTSRPLSVFLCHSSVDKPAVRELYKSLLAEGWIDPWLDEEKLLPGQDWNVEIEKAVENTDVAIVCLSKESVARAGYLQRELKKVLDIADEQPEGTIFLIPVRLNSCEVPRRLTPWEYVDYFPKLQRKVAYQRIIKSLKARLGYEPPKVKKTKRSKNEVPISYFSKVFLVHSVASPRIYSDGVERNPIHVIVDSFDDRLLDKIKKVEYHLHPSFPNPDRETNDRKRRFELKTGIWGEFNLSVDVYFKGYEKPITLYRYINLKNY